MSRARKLPAGVEAITRAGNRVVYRGRYRDSVTGQRHSTDCFATPAEAVAAKVRGMRDLDEAYRKQDIEPVRRAAAKREVPQTVGPLVAAYLAQLQASIATKRNYASTLRLAVEFFGEGTKVADIDRSYVREWVAKMVDEGLARGTRANRLSTLKAVFTLAMEFGVITRNPVDGAGIGQGQRDGERRLGRYPTEQEIILAAYYMPEWLWPAVFVAADSGLRRSELAGLVWSSVDFESGALWVADIVDVDGSHRGYTKRRGGGGWDGEGQAWVPMSARTMEALRALYALRPTKPTDRVFRRPGRDAVAPCTIRQRWVDARAQAMDPELGNVRLHDLRWHTATRAAQVNVPYHVISKVMRHTSPRMTHRYIASPKLDEVSAHYKRAFG